jgi:hypothetical protein
MAQQKHLKIAGKNATKYCQQTLAPGHFTPTEHAPTSITISIYYNRHARRLQ